MERCSRRGSQCGGGEQNLEAPRHVDAPDDPTQASLAGRRRSNSPGIATYADGRSGAFVLSLSHHKGRGHCRAESHHIFGSISERCCRPSMSPVVCAARLGDPDRRTRAAARLYRASVNTAPQQIPLNALTTASGTSRRLSHAYTAVAALAPIQIDQQENEIAVAPF
jgi:hypothetical protein